MHERRHRDTSAVFTANSRYRFDPSPYFFILSVTRDSQLRNRALQSAPLVTVSPLCSPRRAGMSGKTVVRRKSRRPVRGLLAKHTDRAAVVASETRELERRQRTWANRRAVDRAVDVLRTALPSVISGKDWDEVERALIRIGRAVEAARPPAWMRKPDDQWLIDAQHTLDDDEIALILSPAGYSRDREAALKAVRERRRKIKRRR